jgi:hypothetical protein
MQAFGLQVICERVSTRMTAKALWRRPALGDSRIRLGAGPKAHAYKSGRAALPVRVKLS